MEKPTIKKSNNKTSVSFFTLDNQVEKTVREEIEKLFRHTEKNDWRDIIYTCVKELMVNASKSNIKKTFFIEAHIDEKDRKKYDTAKNKVRKLMKDEYFYYLRQKLMKHNHKVEVDFEEKNDGIIISVKNSTPLLPDEEKIIRARMKTAMENDHADLTLFYNSEEEAQSEGASLGLILVINLLRQMGINPALFRVGMIDKETMARIEIPLGENYRPIRKH